jgi:hypothetical protein
MQDKCDQDFQDLTMVRMVRMKNKLMQGDFGVLGHKKIPFGIFFFIICSA